jgi:hypothetical protein
LFPCVIFPPVSSSSINRWNGRLITLKSYSCLGYLYCDLLNDLRIVQGIHKRMVRFQELIQFVFFTSHDHNLHYQQRELSKFLMHYQQFASHAYCGAARSVSKMASQQEKTFFVLRFEVSRSVITVQREFRALFKNDAPHENNAFFKPCQPSLLFNRGLLPRGLSGWGVKLTSHLQLVPRLCRTTAALLVLKTILVGL